MADLDLLPMRLGELLAHADDHEWEEELYVKGPPDQWTAHTPCAVLTSDGVDSPESIRNDGEQLDQTLAIDILQTIGKHLRAQRPTPSEDQYVEAFRHYFTQDTFLDVS